MPTPSPEGSPPTVAAAPAPPRRRWRPSKTLLRILAIVVVIAVLAAAGVLLWQQYSRRNNPVVAFEDALRNSLQTEQVASDLKAPTQSTSASLSLADAENPAVSTKSTIENGATRYDLAGYGDLKNTYVSYSNLPATTPKNVANIAEGAWVHVRSKGLQPPNVPPQVDQAADPTFYAFGQVLFATLSQKTQDELVSFIQKNKVYGFDEKQVTKTTVDDQKVFVYPVKLNIGYLKVAAQSAATNEKIPVERLAGAMAALDPLKGAAAKIYVSTKDHRIVRFDTIKDGKTTVTTYRYSGVSLPAEPPTKLSWQAFAPLQLQIAAVKQ